MKNDIILCSDMKKTNKKSKKNGNKCIKNHEYSMSLEIK